MKVYFITRFSIFDPNKKAWATSRLLEDEYKKTLFSEDRLNVKFEAFETMTLPTILYQTNKNYEWIILASIYLSDTYKNRLHRLVDPHSRIHVKYIDTWKECMNFLESYPYEPNYATVRIDDDDGLTPTYVEMVQKYKNNHGSIVTFPYGIGYKIDNGSITLKKKEINIPHIALGLCAINMNIYKCGDHTKVKNKYPIIYNNTKNVYFLFYSEYCDSGREFNNQ